MKAIIMIFIFQLTMMPLYSHGGIQRNIYILADISDSSPQVRIPPFAQKSAIYVDKIFNDIAPGTEVVFRTFGSYSFEQNCVSICRTILNRKGSRSQDVRLIMNKVISNIPMLVESGKFQIQKETSIIAALKTLSQRLDPSKTNVIVLLSDMLEYSHEANAYRLIKLKNGRLPRPKSGYLKGVEIHAIGAGIGVKNSDQNDRLEELWREYFLEAGASRFIYLTDF